MAIISMMINRSYLFQPDEILPEKETDALSKDKVLVKKCVGTTYRCSKSGITT